VILTVKTTKMKYIYLCFLSILLSPTFSQLLPSIGINSQPANSATLCDQPWYLGSFYTSGLAVGSTVPDFKLYGLNGDSLVLSTALSEGKPVLLIAGSLTCPVFRNKVNTINQVISTYGTAIKVFVIYTLEAHPTDTSVYFGYVNITTANQNAGILFPQPTTYGQRKQMVDTMSYYVSLNAPVFIDGPCDQWWNTFGPAPNNAYLINPAGVIVKKHGWFDKSPDKIFCDIDNYLAINSGSCVVNTAPGNFNLNVLNSFVSGPPSFLLYDFAEVINTQSVTVTLSAKKIQKVLPLDWETAFCADVCYSTAEDSIIFSVAPFDTLLFSLDFFTGATPDSGNVKVGFRNVNKPSNAYTVRFRASTYPQDVSVKEIKNNSKTFNVFPNPVKNQLNISTEEKDFTIVIHNSLGKEIFFGANVFQVNTSQLSNGIYYVSQKTNKGSSVKKIVILN